MPYFIIEQRETWDTIVTYNIEAANENQAKELTETGTCKYEQHEILNRDFHKIINVHSPATNCPN